MEKKYTIIGLTALALLLAAAGAVVGISSAVKGAEPAVFKEQRALYAARPQPGGTVHYDIYYRKKLFNRQALDIYMPTTNPAEAPERGVPAVVFVHGGSWMHGAKEDIRIIDRFLAKMRAEGWAVISIDYVTSPIRLLNGPSANVSRAFEWIHAHAPDYGIDPWNMGVYSVSAGSHLTMEAMVASGDPGSLWRFWLDEIGPVDLVAMADGEAFEASSRLAKFPNRYLKKHSPLLQVDGPFPPTAIAHGDADRVVAIAQSERLAETLAAYGTPVTMKVVPGGDHGFFNKGQEVWEDLEDTFIPFMKRYFRD